MRYSTQIKPISYVKAHAADLLDRISKEREPIIITQNGEAKAVLVDIRTFEEDQERMALLQIMVASEQQQQQGIVPGEPLNRNEVYSAFSSRKPVVSVRPDRESDVANEA